MILFSIQKPICCMLCLPPKVESQRTRYLGNISDIPSDCTYLNKATAIECIRVKVEEFPQAFSPVRCNAGALLFHYSLHNQDDQERPKAIVDEMKEYAGPE